jgi:hypothetical protein
MNTTPDNGLAHAWDAMVEPENQQPDDGPAHSAWDAMVEPDTGHGGGD